MGALVWLALMFVADGNVWLKAFLTVLYEIGYGLGFFLAPPDDNERDG